MAERTIELFEPESPGEEIEAAVRSRFERGMPETVALLSRYVSAERFGREIGGPDGPLTLVDLRLAVDEKALGERYPHVAKAFRKILAPLRLNLAISDLSGARMSDLAWKDSALEFRAAAARGSLYRADRAWEKVEGPPVSLSRVAAGAHTVTFDLSVAALGMRAGVEDMIFRVEFESQGKARRLGNYHSRLDGVPRMKIPVALRPLASLVLGDFLEVLRYGDGGSGIDYRVRYAVASPPPRGVSGNIQSIQFRLPLKNSPILSLLLRMGRAIRGSVDRETRAEFRDLLGEIAAALDHDYLAARANARRADAPRSLAERSSPAFASEPAGGRSREETLVAETSGAVR
ncbi:MAG: hypothetical protein ACRD1Z_15025 [Vicinamibacteria bacterium]